MSNSVTIGEVAIKVGSGATPQGGSNVYTTEGVAFIRSQNVLDNSMRLYDVARISDQAAHALRSVAVERGDVLLNITGDSVARCCIVDSTLLPARVNQHVAIIRVSDRIDPRFLQRVLVEPSMKAQLLAISDGGTRKALTKAMIESLEIPCPPIAEQRAIAEALEALDDKIALNEKTCQLSLELADAKFDIAVKNIRFSDETFADFAEIAGGGTPNTSVQKYWDGDICWATPTDVTGLHSPYLFSTKRMITEAGLSNCSSKLHPRGSILMTSRATIGAFAFAQTPTAVNQGFIVVNTKHPDQQFWLFHEMRSRVDEFISHANGATFLELNRSTFKKLLVRIPDSNLIRSFSQAVSPLHELAAQMMAETAILTATRDELLPLLMSGKIRVRDAEKVVEEVV